MATEEQRRRRAQIKRKLEARRLRKDISKKGKEIKKLKRLDLKIDKKEAKLERLRKSKPGFRFPTVRIPRGETGKDLFKLPGRAFTLLERSQQLKGRQGDLARKLIANSRAPPSVVARAVANAERLTGIERVERIKQILRERKGGRII